MHNTHSIAFLTLALIACGPQESDGTNTEETTETTEATSTESTDTGDWYTTTTDTYTTTGAGTGSGTGTGTGAGTGSGTGSGTGTGTGATTPVTNDGTYLGTIDLTFTFTQRMLGRQFQSYCSLPISVVVDEAATPQIAFSEFCDLSAIGFGASTEMVFEGTVLGTSEAEGTMTIDDAVLVVADWTTAGFYSGDTFTGTMDGMESFVGGDLEWTGGWSAQK